MRWGLECSRIDGREIGDEQAATSSRTTRRTEHGGRAEGMLETALRGQPQTWRRSRKIESRLDLPMDRRPAIFFEIKLDANCIRNNVAAFARSLEKFW